MKPDQERVKNLLLDTVTLLCKNSLQYENKLRVEGLLGVCVDDSEVFFLHISENFHNTTVLELSSSADITNDSHRDSSHDRDEISSHNQHQQDTARQVKAEPQVHEVESDSEDVIITSSASLNSPHTVAQPATVVAGQRRTPHKRTHSPAFRDTTSNVQQHHDSSHLSQNSLNSSHHHPMGGGGTTVGDAGDYVSYTECGDGTSFDQLQGQHLIKQESTWDQEPVAKRHLTTDTSPWPNLAGLGDLAAQAAQAAQEAEEGGGGSYSQPGCSTWPSSAQILANSGVQDSMFSWGRVAATASNATSLTAGTSNSSGAPPSVALLGSGGFTIHRHVCPECHSVFTNAAALEKHSALRHRGEKPWVCSVCAAAFARKDYLESHFRIHTGEKPFRCQLCAAAFRQKGKLNKHMATVHRAEQALAGVKFFGEGGVCDDVSVCGDVGECGDVGMCGGVREAATEAVVLCDRASPGASLEKNLGTSSGMEEVGAREDQGD